MGQFFVQAEKNGGPLGTIDPQVGMVTDWGTVISLTVGSGVATATAGSGSIDFYPHQAFVGSGHAVTDYAWPTGVGNYPYPIQTFSGVPPATAVYVHPNGTPTRYNF